MDSVKVASLFRASKKPRRSKSDVAAHLLGMTLLALLVASLVFWLGGN